MKILIVESGVLSKRWFWKWQIVSDRNEAVAETVRRYVSITTATKAARAFEKSMRGLAKSLRVTVAESLDEE